MRETTTEVVGSSRHFGSKKSQKERKKERKNVMNERKKRKKGKNMSHASICFVISRQLATQQQRASISKKKRASKKGVIKHLISIKPSLFSAAAQYHNDR